MLAFHLPTTVDKEPKKRINHRSFIGTGDFMRFFIMSDCRRSLLHIASLQEATSVG